ncbi:DUF4393 domain-containing protein [Micavibrio aeruginosavorus]|uniref:DUF4393 domain-containing protein n=1 Tax=Micavibrio aeruginosavorus TaxID=349221 RepID=UPI0011D1A155|nr:DUF4393 domain-containing protein [Micavibrio aeruginosavorus]
MTNIKNGIDGLVSAIDLCKESEHGAEAINQLGKSAVTVTRAINNFLLPIAAFNFGCEKAKAYFSERFEYDFSEKMKNVDPEDVIEPKSSVAAQALQGLAFSHEESELKEMYLSLLASASNKKSRGSVHPSYVQIIREMTSDEAKILASRYVFGSIPVADIHLYKGTGGFNTVATNVSMLAESAGCDFKDMGPTYIDNLCRLGVFEIKRDQRITDDSAYAFVEGLPLYRELQEFVSKNPVGARVEYKKKVMHLTTLGTLFIRTCISS